MEKLVSRNVILLLFSFIHISQQAINVQDANSRRTLTDLKAIKPQKRVTPVKDAEKLSILRTQDNSLDLNTNGEEAWNELTHNIPLNYIASLYAELNRLAHNENRPKRLWGATADIDAEQYNLKPEIEVESKKSVPGNGKVERPLGLWGKDNEPSNTEVKLPLGLWGKDYGANDETESEPLPIGLWGKDIEAKDKIESEPLPIGLWGKDIDTTYEEDNKPYVYKGKLPIGLWGKDSVNDLILKNWGKNSGPPPGLWGKDSKPIPGIWGKDVGPPPGLWGKKDSGPPPGLWGKKDQPPIGMWGKSGVKDSRPHPGLWGKRGEEIEKRKDMDWNLKENRLSEYPACLLENPPCEDEEEKDTTDSLSGPPPGLWGKREEENVPPWRGGLWGRSETLENSVHDSKQSNNIDMELAEKDSEKTKN